ncbi:AI-2E family transporter, partial [Pseudorhodobacter sp.]|uniref:AI-2E family transporter n=1 Tax=Pseudorhodobacter sp. TaxID=1934400 RepID=UPI00264A0AD6
MTSDSPPLTVLVNAALLVVLAGFLLVVGKPVLLPILASVIAVYVLVNASEALGRLPVIRRFPKSLRRILVLLIFAAAVLALTGVVVNTITQILREAPTYQVNIERLVAQAADTLGVNERPDWQTIRDATFGRLSVQKIINTALLNVTSIGASLFLVIVYSAFLLAERGGFAAKLSVAMKDPENAARTEMIIRDINGRIGDYLAAKTLVNIILSVIS